MNRLTEALNTLPIEKQKKILGKWLDGIQAAAEFDLFAVDRVDDFCPDMNTETKLILRKIQSMLVASIVTFGDLESVDDPLIREFFSRRTATLQKAEF